MTLKIRLAKTGKTHKSLFRIVVAPARSKRSSSIDILGFYNPPVLNLDREKYQKWQKLGAQPSEGLRKILQKEEK